MRRTILSFSTTFFASSLLIPSCNHKTLAPIETVSFAISKASLEGLNTSTISTGLFISVNFAKTSSPKIFLPFAKGFTG